MLNVRQAQPEDTPFLARIYQATRKHAFTWVPQEKFRLNDYYDSIAGEEVWVAEIKSATDHAVLVGFMSIWAKDSFIHNLFILPEWQGQGIGTKLLKKALECFPQPLTLKVNIANKQACRFYEKRGWSYVRTDEEAAEPFHLYQYKN